MPGHQHTVSLPTPKSRDFPGGPVIQTPHFQCNRGASSIPGPDAKISPVTQQGRRVKIKATSLKACHYIKALYERKKPLFQLWKNPPDTIFTAQLFCAYSDPFLRRLKKKKKFINNSPLSSL